MEMGVLNGRYRLLELIGSGGMAVVYRGVDLLLQRDVAIKVLREGYASDPAFLARFRREAQAAARLHHPNIVTVYDVGQDGSQNYIVMEYVDGQDLKSYIRQRGRLSVAEALNIAIQICAGAGHAHKAGVIHCDIKPQNVLVTKDGLVKVTDFGIARALSELALTEAETVWGSPLYFSPEQAAGEPPSPASDVYSIGVTLFEMLAGVPPFQAEKATALALMHMRQEPPPLGPLNPQVGPQLEWIVRKVLAKEPAARYRTAEQLAYVLSEYRRSGEQVTGYQPAAVAALPARGAPVAPPMGAPPSRAPLPVDSQATTAVDLAAEAAGPDWLTGVLIVLALVAVLGLIPLWALVYRAYSASPPLPAAATPVPLATLTGTVQLVSVPAVVGRPLEVATRTLAAAELHSVVEERQEADKEPGVVLEQQPSAGQMVPVGSEVTLVVNNRGPELVMPQVVGYALQDVRAGLESNGWQVVAQDAWSQRPEGTVLSQQPPPGAKLYSGDTVTLTVSGRVDTPIPLEVNLADLLVLSAAQLSRREFHPGDPVQVTLLWRALRAVDTHYVVFVHLIGPGGGLVAQQDVAPAVSTRDWAPGVEIVDRHEVIIPASAPPGQYQLRAGMYPQGAPGDRLSVADPGRTTVESNSILITALDVTP